MTNDKDSAVLAESVVSLYLFDTEQDRLRALEAIRIATERLRQPTQSDALLEGDTQTILYLLGVRHGREDERAKIAAELDARGLGIREKNDD
jgi:hypothetical protein